MISVCSPIFLTLFLLIVVFFGRSSPNLTEVCPRYAASTPLLHLLSVRALAVHATPPCPDTPASYPPPPTRAGHNNTPVTPLLLPQQQISANNLTIFLGARTESEMRSLPFYELSKIHKKTLTFLSYKLGHEPKQQFTLRPPSWGKQQTFKTVCY